MELHRAPAARCTTTCELRSAGLPGRANHFTVVPERVVPVLAALAATAGPGAVPNTTRTTKEQERAGP
jgi:hypothetical protein